MLVELPLACSMPGVLRWQWLQHACVGPCYAWSCILHPALHAAVLWSFPHPGSLLRADAAQQPHPE